MNNCECLNQNSNEYEILPFISKTHKYINHRNIQGNAY